MLKQRDEALSVLDRIWEKVPEVSEEESNNDIEQTIAEVRAEKKRKKEIILLIRVVLDTNQHIRWIMCQI